MYRLMPSIVTAWSTVIWTFFICAYGLCFALAYSATAIAARSRSVAPCACM